ncbi:MAG: EAL domain-containing protein, partial [Rhizobiales bacterium]|nr:EAL domain-containing protein [Hyphomicrobiales bacterium]
HLALNLSAEDLHSDRVVHLMGGLARATKAGPGNLVVEATERGLIDMARASPVVGKLRAQGIVVAIDDFGTGYSNLAELERWEVDCLKIDRSFIESIDRGAATSRVVPAIIEMARARGLEIVAEGISTQNQLNYLRDRGVHLGQGWLFAQAMPFAEFEEHVASASARAEAASPTFGQLH